MRLILIIICLTLLCCSETKTGYEKYNTLAFNAMIQFKDKKFKESLNNFEKALKLKPNDEVSNYFFAAAAALNLEKDEEAKELIINSVINTNASKEYLLSFKEFDPFRKKKMFNEIQEDYEKNRSIFFKNLKHPEIYREIDSLIEKDQEIRTNEIDYELMRITDSLNINRLIDITSEYGWQKKGWLLLWHQRGTYGEDNFVWNFFKPYIDDQIKEDNIKKDFWTMFEDERSIINNKHQIYGHYWNQLDQYPLIDIENVDKRRRLNGLPPLWYMKKIYGIELPKGYRRNDNINL